VAEHFGSVRELPQTIGNGGEEGHSSLALREGRRHYLVKELIEKKKVQNASGEKPGGKEGGKKPNRRRIVIRQTENHGP